MFYWTRYRYHGNTAGSKPALNNGFDLFSENPVVKFFPSFVSIKLRKILVSWNFDRDLLLFCVLHFNVFWTCPLWDFNFCLQTSYTCSEPLFYRISLNSNERFRRNQCISTKPCSHNFLVDCACVAFERVLDRSFSIHTNNPRKAGCFPIVLPTCIIHWKTNIFTHNKLCAC